MEGLYPFHANLEKRGHLLIKIVSFSTELIPQAQSLLLAEYRRAQQLIPGLCPASPLPDLVPFAENGLGVAAVQEGCLLGFLGCNPPRQNAFGTQAAGVFSPLHAHAAQPQNRKRIFHLLYQAAAEKWVISGALYHSIALWAWDEPGIDAFFRYGFGMRCVDGIRPLPDFPQPQIPASLSFRQLTASQAEQLKPLQQKLRQHLAQSPCFLNPFPGEPEPADSHRFFAAFDGETPVAFLETADKGETFLTSAPDMQNICGAFCLPEYRGGLFLQLLRFAAGQLRQQGFQRLGVDYESFNPTALGFWEKEFVPYTRGLARRIDEPL